MRERGMRRAANTAPLEESAPPAWLARIAEQKGCKVCATKYALCVSNCEKSKGSALATTWEKRVHQVVRLSVEAAGGAALLLKRPSRSCFNRQAQSEVSAEDCQGIVVYEQMWALAPLTKLRELLGKA